MEIEVGILCNKLLDKLRKTRLGIYSNNYLGRDLIKLEEIFKTSRELVKISSRRIFN